MTLRNRFSPTFLVFSLTIAVLGPVALAHANPTDGASPKDFAARLAQENERAKNAAEAAEPRVPRSSWVNQFKSHFAKGFCEQSKVFVDCYSSTEKACRTKVDEATASCARELKLPDTIAEGGESSAQGRKLGLCVGQRVHKLNRAQLRRVPACQDALSWL